MNQPKISVIIPIYNSEAYLVPCLDSIFSQTFADFQVICINDGSTDNSLSILEKYKKEHANMEIYSQKNLYAGVARNLGMENAKGDYFLFLDADDTFSPDFFQKMYEKITLEDADICICGANNLNTETNEIVPNPRYLKTEFLPEKSVFSGEDIPDYLFHFTSPAPWNKLFSASFVKQKQLRFQPLKRSNDLYFVYMALVCANKITVINEPFVNYRIGQTGNLQSANSETPLLFAEALKAVKASMEEEGVFTKYQKSFANSALRHCTYNLSSQKSEAAYHQVFCALNEGLFEEFLISKLPQKDFYATAAYSEYLKISSLSYEEFLFQKMKKLKEKLNAREEKIEKLKQENSNLKKEVKELKKTPSSLSKKLSSLLHPAK